jgi:hypothetical protein
VLFVVARIQINIKREFVVDYFLLLCVLKEIGKDNAQETIFQVNILTEKTQITLINHVDLYN